MIKLNINAARIPGMTQAQYHRYLMDNHARLVLDTEPVARHLTSYVQQHVFDAAYGSAAPTWRFDSVSHICARSVQDQQAATSTREYREIVAPDEPNFADGRSAMFILFSEKPLRLPTAGLSRHRLLHYVKRAEGVSAHELQTAWQQAHDAALERLPGLSRAIRRAVFNEAQEGFGPPPAFQAMGELGFVQRSDAVLMGDYVTLIEGELGPRIEATHSFYLLADAFPVRGTLD